jgi:hypothetical protein
MKIGNIKIRRNYKINDIKVGIAKVFPSLINLEVNPTKEKQVFNHENSYGYDEVVVNPVTNEVDENIKPNNIRAGVNILGVEGTIENIDYWSTEIQGSYEIDLRCFIKEFPKNIDVSNATNIYISNTYKSLEKADLSKWDLSNVTKIKFSNSPLLKELIIDNYNTEKITTLSEICYFCEKLEKVVLKINSSNVTNMSNAFYYDKNITELDLSALYTPNLQNINYAFYGCSKLMKLDIRNMTFDNVTSFSNPFESVPNNCLVIVKGETEKEWVLARKKYFTNVKTVAELGE